MTDNGIMGSDHLGPLYELTDVTENITFPQNTYAGSKDINGLEISIHESE